METVALVISSFLTMILIIYLSTRKNKNQLQEIFIVDSSLVLVWCILLVAQKYFCAATNINPIVFDYFIYICICFLPVSFLFTGLIFSNTKITLKKRYLLLFIVPITSLIMLWTNNWHHLFYENYSINMNETIFGKYFYIHNIYTLALYFIGLIYLVKYSIKNSGIFSKQAMLIIVAALLPITINLLGSFQIISVSIYLTPICFSFTVLLCAVAIFKFQFLGVTPIALQKIVDRISDGYVVLNEYYIITDFNKTLLDVFKLKPEDLRSKNFIKFLSDRKINEKAVEKIKRELKKANKTGQTISFEQHFEKINKYFKIEITPINSENNSLGTLFLLKDITQHKKDMQTIKNNQEILMERERLAALGQLIGGIAHNLKTPIMSIAGAVQGLENLIKEYDESIDDPLVNSQDHHDIAKDMETWIPKIRTYLEYMSDIITTVKGQAVALVNNKNDSFTVGELVKRVNILMKHELKNAYIYMNVIMKADENQILKGNVNSLVQVVNNMISNAIQAYNGKHDQNIELEINKKGDNVIFSITDFAGGLPLEVQDKLFKEMVTTKGKNGTGLGLYMSYSNIKAHFGGDITYKTEIGKGTTFNIIIPVKK